MYIYRKFDYIQRIVVMLFTDSLKKHFEIFLFFTPRALHVPFYCVHKKQVLSFGRHYLFSSVSDEKPENTIVWQNSYLLCRHPRFGRRHCRRLRNGTWFSRLHAARSVAALTCHRHVIHFRAPSSPSDISHEKSKDDFLVILAFLVRVTGLEPARKSTGS